MGPEKSDLEVLAEICKFSGGPSDIMLFGKRPVIHHCLKGTYSSQLKSLKTSGLIEEYGKSDVKSYVPTDLGFSAFMLQNPKLTCYDQQGVEI